MAAVQKKAGISEDVRRALAEKLVNALYAASGPAKLKGVIEQLQHALDEGLPLDTCLCLVSQAGRACWSKSYMLWTYVDCLHLLSSCLFTTESCHWSSCNVPCMKFSILSLLLPKKAAAMDTSPAMSCCLALTVLTCFAAERHQRPADKHTLKPY